MPRPYINLELRRLVALRADRLCEYCLISESDWGEHFRLDESAIQPRTDIGEVTVRILEFNNDDRIIERQTLIEVGKYPSAAARQRMIE